MRNELSKARFWKRFRIGLLVVIVLTAEILLLFGVLNVLSDVNYQVTGFYLNIQLIGIVVITLELLFNCVLFLLAKNLKSDVFDLYADSSIDQVEFNIHELIRLRNDIARHHGVENKLVLTVVRVDESKSKVLSLVSEKVE